ncbi:glycerate kinase, partial [Halobacillus sp. BBL2006]|uniref:glycerate kinase n=1 Tax=Halobacillus sp. BBL2006 TaxID=1543706 RepID=UPI0005443D1A
PYEGEEAALIECARSTGLTLVPDDQRDPFLLNSYGLGEQIKCALEMGIRHLVVSLGGSATTDGGTGLLQALGYRFFNDQNEELPPNRNILCDIERIDECGVLPELKDCQVIVASDVTNPFYGEQGAAHVYGPQKGATEADVYRLDSGLRKFASVWDSYTGVDLQTIDGA